jgi:hypothetical protein
MMIYLTNVISDEPNILHLLVLNILKIFDMVHSWLNNACLGSYCELCFLEPPMSYTIYLENFCVIICLTFFLSIPFSDILFFIGVFHK